MNNPIKPLALISLFTFASISLLSNANETQQNTQDDNQPQQSAVQPILVPVVNPHTGEIESYGRCTTVPHCEDPSMADLAPEDDNN